MYNRKKADVLNDRSLRDREKEKKRKKERTTEMYLAVHFICPTNEKMKKWIREKDYICIE